MAPVAPPLRTTQVILAAFALGVLTFLGVVLFLRLSGAALGAQELPVALYFILIVLVPIELSVYFVLRKVFVARAESLEAVRQGRVPLPLHGLSLLGGALAESVGLLGVVMLQLGGSWVLLAAPGLSIALILLQIPTRDRLERIVREV